jgi:thiamine transport system substrate-binding protein
MTSPRTRLALVAAALALAVSITACSSDDAADGGDGDTGDGEKVVLVTYESFALPEEAAAAFTAATGAEIEVVASGDSGTMLTKALLSAGAPEGDVIFGIDNTLATRALSEDLLEPFTPDGLDAVPESYRLDGDAGERLVPIDTGDVCINYDQTWFAEQGLAAPTTMEQLTEPAYRDLTVLESPVTSSPGLAFLVGTIARYGEDGWLDYWQRLEDNGVSVRPSWDDAYYTDYTVSGGDRPIVLSYASSPPVELVFAEGAFEEPPSAVMLDSCAAQVEYAGVLAGAEHPELARELVEFMLTPEWQAALPMANFVFPVIDVELPEEFTAWAPRATDPLRLPPATIDEQRDAWIEAWREQME